MLWQTEFEDTMTFNVLSLFDGMSCGQIALNKAGIKYDNYFASEVDEHTIKVAQHNYPDTIQVGDITELDGTKLPKIDLLLGGSPCQGFSFAGKQLNFEDPRSELLFEFVRILEETEPKYFLLENVQMRAGYQDIISNYLGVEPIKINSALVSAQSRVRLYWTNIPNIKQPKDKGILLRDIIEDDGYVNRQKSYVLTTRYSTYEDLERYFFKSRHQIVFESKAYFDAIPMDIKVIKKYPKKWRILFVNECEKLQTVPLNYTACVPDSKRYMMLGNGWTVDVISHILKSIKNNPKPKGRQQLGLLSCDEVVPLLMTKIM